MSAEIPHVALVAYPDEAPRFAVRASADLGGWHILGVGFALDADNITVHPLAVIDPQAPIPDEWLTAFCGAGGLYGSERIRTALAALFAHIAAPQPPKPDEPTGLGAVVRDYSGYRWVRAEVDRSPWYCTEQGDWLRWIDLDVPADGVLFGGVE